MTTPIEALKMLVEAPREVWHSRMGRGAVLLQVGRMFGGGY